MKEILIVYPQMMMGGSTTSLLAILNNIDYKKYKVDLLLLFRGGPLFDKIPAEVNILPWGHKYQNRTYRIIMRLLSLRYMQALVMSKYISWKDKNPRHGFQFMSSADVDFYRGIDKTYDIAIGFIEGYSNKYVARHVKAKKKIGWIHTDYKNAGFSAKYDDEYVEKLDNIICVSERCLESFNEYLPKCIDRSVVIENILSTKNIRNLSSEIIDDFVIDSSKINFVTVCRITLNSKGLDRVINILIKHKNNTILDKFRWYIIGDGPDLKNLRKMISYNNLEDKVIMLGKKINPFPYMKNMDMFLLPSLYEGKPISVTEAMMLGIPPLVTNYSSASEQVRNGYDGIVVENNNEAIYEALKKVLDYPEIIQELRANLLNKDYSNIKEIEKVNKLLEK
jgi:glycosyltransferase involved in cell wall biosynthesis